MAPNYYEILKVSQNASTEDIKHAYRKLAHIYHPDKSTGSNNAFISISLAYAVLSNPEKRKVYDLSLNSQNSKTSDSYRPIYDHNLCQGCGIRAPLKHVRLFQNIGLLFQRKSRSIEGNLCKNCIDKYFSRFTLTTFIFGWWGLISFFVTIGYLANNLFMFLGSAKMKTSLK